MRLPQAFLSHSSTDKIFVDEVAAALGREFCVYDQYCFHAGDDLLRAIDGGVRRSALIVLFASPAALGSDWVQLELKKGQERRLAEATYRGLALGIGAKVTHADLPSWLRQTRFEAVHNPQQAARIVRTHIDTLIRESSIETFVGRRTESAQFENELAAAVEPPRLLYFQGLPAIGRRTLCGRLARDLLGFQRLVEIPVPSGETLQDIAITFASHIEPYRSQEDFKRRVSDLKSLTDADAARYSGSSADALVSGGALPVLVDEGGFMTDPPRLSQSMELLLDACATYPKSYVGLVSVRRIELPAAVDQRTARVYVGPLDPEDTRRLLALLLRRANQSATDAQIRALAEHCKGHPTSAKHAARLAVRYGVDVLLGDVRRLVDFRASFFVSYLRENILSDEGAGLLKLLAFYRSLPLRVIGRTLRLSPDKVTKLLYELIDLALIHPGEKGLYTLSHPVEDAVLRVFGITGVDHDAVATALASYLEDAAPDERHIELNRALYRASRLSSAPPGGWALRTMAELLRLARDLYNDGEYDRAISLLQEVLADDPRLRDARQLLIRAQIKSDKFADASETNQAFRAAGMLRDYYYLEGFSLRKQGKPAEAREMYLEAERRGRNDLPLFREIGLCCMLLDDYVEAEDWIRRATAVEPGNRFVLDLGVLIAVRQRDASKARSLLERLQLIDKAEFYWFRRSTVEYLEGQVRAALSSALKAVTSVARPTFAMLSQVAKCRIEMGEINEAAKAIRTLEQAFPRGRRDIKLGLWCKWELAQGKYENAEGYWNRLSDKSLPVHRALRMDIVRGLRQQRGLSDEQRSNLQLELDDLTASVDNAVPRYVQVDVDIVD